MATTSVTLTRLAESFAIDLRAEGKASLSVTAYRNAVLTFARWLDDRGESSDISSLTPRRVKDYIGSMRDKGLSQNTIFARIAGLKAFANWLTSEGEVKRNPLADIQYPKREIKPVPVIADQQLKKLISTVSGPTFVKRRNEALVRVLLDTGIRVSELTGIRLDEIDMSQGEIVVHGKGNKTRRVYFGARTARALDRYLRMRDEHRWSHLPNLWLGERGAIKHGAIQQMLTAACIKAGIDHIHPHRFRHTTTHDLLANGAQEREVIRLMGWTNGSMLSRYGASMLDERAAATARRLARGDRV